MYTSISPHPNTLSERIFVGTNLMKMQKQYCKVGAVTPITSGNHAISTLEVRYASFLQKASESQLNPNLGEFFKRKAEQIRKVLESLA